MSPSRTSPTTGRVELDSYREALPYALDKKAVLLGPLETEGVWLLADAARQVTLADTGRDCFPAGLGTLPRVRIGRGGDGPWGLEPEAFDLILDFRRHVAGTGGDNVPIRTLLGPDGIYLRRGGHPEQWIEAYNRFDYGSQANDGGRLVRRPGPEPKEEKRMNSEQGWTYQAPPVENESGRVAPEGHPYPGVEVCAQAAGMNEGETPHPSWIPPGTSAPSPAFIPRFGQTPPPPVPEPAGWVPPAPQPLGGTPPGRQGPQPASVPPPVGRAMVPSASPQAIQREVDALVASLEESVGQVHMTAAGTLISLGAYKQALSHAEAGVKFGSPSGENLNTLGWLQYLEGQDQAALESFATALGQDPTSGDILNNQGMVLFSMGRKEEAGASWEAAIRSGYATPEIFNNLGVIRHEQGRQAEAMELFQRSLQVDPNFKEARENLQVYGGGPAR